MLLNQERLLTFLDRYDLDALIATLPVNVTYASGFYHRGQETHCDIKIFAVLPKNLSQAALILPMNYFPSLLTYPTWIEDIHLYGTFYVERPKELDRQTDFEEKIDTLLAQVKVHSDPFEALKEVLEKRGLIEGRLGIDESPQAVTLRREIFQKIPNLRVQEGGTVFQQLRMVKTEEELKRLKRSFEITEKGIRAIVDRVKEGVTEREIAARFRVAVSEEEGIPGFWHLSAGTASATLRSPSRYAVKRGDIIRLDLGCTYECYWSDMGRTLVLGNPTGKIQKIYECICEAQEKAFRIIRPGARASDIFMSVMEHVKSKAVPTYRRHHLGHGIGLEIYEPPLIKPATVESDIFLAGTADVVLEENMVINIEIPYYELGFGGLQIEDPVVVTPAGCKRLTSLSRDLFVVA